MERNSMSFVIGMFVGGAITMVIYACVLAGSDR